MIDLGPFLILSAGVFAGALVSSVAGFAFSGVAGAMLLHVLPPTEAVPFMMICSIGVRSTSLVVLRRRMSWRGSSVLIVGGALGTPPALYLLQHVDVWTFRAAGRSSSCCSSPGWHWRSRPAPRSGPAGFPSPRRGLTALPRF